MNHIKEGMLNTGIILEGADQSGKSTLASRLADLTGMKVFHYEPPKGVTDFAREYLRFMEESDRPMIVDRCYLSEMVYGPIFRGASGVTPEVKERVEASLSMCGYVMVLVHRRDFGRHNFEDRKELYDYDGIMRVRAAFEREFESVTLPKIKIDAFDWPHCLWDVVNLCTNALFSARTTRGL